MDCSRPRAMPEGGPVSFAGMADHKRGTSPTGIPPNRPGRRSNGCAKLGAAPLQTVARRSDAFAFVASDGKGKGRFAGQSMRWRPHSRQQAEALQFAAADILRGPSTQSGAGARLQPKKDLPWAAEYPGAANPDLPLGDEIACKTNTLAFGTGLVLISVDRDCLCSKWKTFSQQGD